MSRDVRNLVLAGVCGTVAVLGWQAWPVTAATAQTDSKPATAVVEYRTVGTDFTALAATLTDLGNDGWHVVNILHTDQIVETGGDGVTHLVARRLEVVATRPRAK
jgi:hypothetical protein